MSKRWLLKALVIGVGLATLAIPPATGADDGPNEGTTTDDAGTGADAGNRFDTATPVTPKGHYRGRLAADTGDRHDYLRFPIAKGGSLSVTVDFAEQVVEPVELLDPKGNVVDAGMTLYSIGASATSATANEVYAVRLSVHHAVEAGDYRLHLTSSQPATYHLCFMNCDDPVSAPIEMIFGGSLPSPYTSVLLIPPAHGDLGNPSGPTVLDYIDATLRGIRRWESVLHRFAADYPEFSYLADITVDIEIFDELNPVDPSGYDVVIGYVAAGPVFRGVATATPFGFPMTGDTHVSGRFIELSLYGSSPRAGQALYDFPEISDLETVTLHEFGHTFGLGHTITWHPEHGPDLMNSPAPFVYGDGSPVGDGGERTPIGCFSTLDLYGMAHLYRWLPSGDYQWSWGMVDLPKHIPYKLYC